jgi:hypothetical protein
MNSTQPIIADGAERWKNTPEARAALRKLRRAVEARCAEEVARSGFIRRWLIRRRIELDVRSEWQKLGPSSQSLFFDRPADG